MGTDGSSACASGTHASHETASPLDDGKYYDFYRVVQGYPADEDFADLDIEVDRSVLLDFNDSLPRRSANSVVQSSAAGAAEIEQIRNPRRLLHEDRINAIVPDHH